MHIMFAFRSAFKRVYLLTAVFLRRLALVKLRANVIW